MAYDREKVQATLADIRRHALSIIELASEGAADEDIISCIQTDIDCLNRVLDTVREAAGVEE